MRLYEEEELNWVHIKLTCFGGLERVQRLRALALPEDPWFLASMSDDSQPLELGGALGPCTQVHRSTNIPTHPLTALEEYLSFHTCSLLGIQVSLKIPLLTFFLL